MKNLEKLLAENMRRFNTKNLLSEDTDQNNNGFPDKSETDWFSTYYIYLGHLPNPDYTNILKTHHADRIKKAFENAGLRAKLDQGRYYDELEIGIKKEDEKQILDTLRKIGYAPDTVEDLYRRAAWKLGMGDNTTLN